MIETPKVSDESIVSERDLADLTPDPSNARRHTDKNLDMIRSSIQESGTGRSILIDENDVILAGNATVQAAQQAGLTKVKIIDADGDTIIAVRRSNLSAEEKTRLALFDNRANDLSSFDPLMLAGLQAEGVSLDGLWTGDELDALLADLPSMDDYHSDETGNSLPEPSAEYKAWAAGAGERGLENDRQSEEEMRLRRENTQEREVSPRPPSAYTHPYQAPPEEPGQETNAAESASVSQAPSVAGLDRVTPDQETSRAGLFIHFRGLKIPLSAEEGAALDARLAAYRDTAGTFYGFIGSLLGPDATEQNTEGMEGEADAEDN